MQTSECVKPGYPLFTGDDYQQAFARKRVFEEAPPNEKLEEVFQWTTTEAYKQLNFQREALTINPAKACQPLGAVLCALGFYKTLPYVHGSQGCVAYFRTYFNRHFREPIAAVSDSMTEDAAVFGGQKNMFEGLENALKLYQPEMMAVSTTCMAEVIGDDLNAFIANARRMGGCRWTFPFRSPIPPVSSAATPPAGTTCWKGCCAISPSTRWRAKRSAATASSTSSPASRPISAISGSSSGC